MKWLWITFLVLISETLSIQTRIKRPVRFVDQKAIPTRNFRHIDSSGGINLDWEHGLREATVQALFREHVGDHNLRKHIYSAPLLGKQDKATPFGDVAILARGQLYANYAGYIFVQDPYQHDCDDCYNIDAEAIRVQCINAHCQIWHPRNNEQLIVLWSIKRIRHRSLRDGYNKLEVEFTISPVGLRYPKDRYLTKEGTFNYNLPGHVFILRSSETHQNLDNVQNVNHFKHGAFIAQTPDGRKYILHSFPGILTPETPRYYTPPKDSLPTSTTTTQYTEEDAKKVYQTLLEVLHKKTSLEPNRFTPPTQKTSTTISETTLVQFPDGQVVPITEVETPFITKTTPGYVTVRFPEIPHTTSAGLPKEQSTTPSRPVFKPATTNAIPQTSVPTTSRVQPQSSYVTSTTQEVYTPPQQTIFVAPPPTSGFTPHTTNEMYKPTTVSNHERPQYPSTTQSVNFSTTKPPIKTTFHFFAAEEKEKITSEAPRKPLTTISQQEYTVNESIFTDIMESAEPTKSITESTKHDVKTTQGLKETTKYQPTAKNQFITISSARPATVVKVTKPNTEATYTASTISSTYHTTEPSTKIIPSILFEPFTTTKQSYSDFTNPITVLEDTSVGSTSQEIYPTTRFGESFVVNQPPSTSIREPTVTVSTIKHTDLQFYNPTTTHLTPEEYSTTLLQRFTTVVGTQEPTFDTTYVKVPTLLPNNENVETTMGITTMMGASQNKTTGTVYYTAEETTIPIKVTSPNTLPSKFTTSPNNLLETESVTTPKRIVTSIAADGTVSVKTTPFYADEEIFGLRKSSTKKYKTTKPYKVSTTDEGDFLVEDGSHQDYKGPLFKKPLKDYNEDDIFGSTKSTYIKTSKKASVTREYTKSDLEQALFDRNNRKSKALVRRKSSTTESTPSKVLYSNFFETSTLAMTKQPQVTTLPSVVIVTPSATAETAPITRVTPVVPRKSFSVSKKPKFTISDVGKVNKQAEIDKIMPVTSQSYLTSISYEVNKRKRPSSNEIKEINVNTTSNNNKRDQRLKMMKRMDDVLQTKSEVKPPNPKKQSGNQRGLDNDFALRLVSQAKGVAYLDTVSTTSASTIASTSAKTTKKSKYTRRRSYVPRAKRPKRKKNANTADNR